MAHDLPQSRPIQDLTRPILARPKHPNSARTQQHQPNSVCSSLTSTHPTNAKQRVFLLCTPADSLQACMPPFCFSFSACRSRYRLSHPASPPRSTVPLLEPPMSSRQTSSRINRPISYSCTLSASTPPFQACLSHLHSSSLQLGSPAPSENHAYTASVHTSTVPQLWHLLFAAPSSFSAFQAAGFPLTSLLSSTRSSYAKSSLEPSKAITPHQGCHLFCSSVHTNARSQHVTCLSNQSTRRLPSFCKHASAPMPPTCVWARPCTPNGLAHYCPKLTLQVSAIYSHAEGKIKAGHFRDWKKNRGQKVFFWLCNLVQLRGEDKQSEKFFEEGR